MFLKMLITVNNGLMMLTEAQPKGGSSSNELRLLRSLLRTIVAALILDHVKYFSHHSMGRGA